MAPQNLLHRLTLRKFIDEFIEVANFLHERFFDGLDAHTANDACDEVTVGIQGGSFRKNVSKSVPLSRIAAI